ncbi:uncharacterized protein LOC130664882 [Microplitis mediator]|uniref:uncharacterized protein LOC130664882 n=1 Tax=Microplitis mediator TaxID=375433 RepID=UPI00255661B9|nr:uncharacterized protein LOC130664882 [Microplitis mediator]
MSELKYIARPKVRFSETSESADDSTSSSRPGSSRVRIKSIENVKKPFKLVREVRDSLNLKRAVKSVQMSTCQVGPKSSRIKSTETEAGKIIIDADNSGKVESNKENIKNDRENCLTKKSSNSLTAGASKDCKVEMDKITKILDSVSIKTPGQLKTKKVNEDLNKKPGNNNDFKNLNSKVGGNQAKLSSHQLKTSGNQLKSSGNQSRAPGPHKSSGAPSKSSGIQSKSSGVQSKSPGIQSKSLGVHSKSAGVELKSSGNQTKASVAQKLPSKSPGAFKKPPDPVKKTQIKVTTARNKSVSRPNVYVGPGILKARSLPSVSDPKPTSRLTNYPASDKLRRPEYNSVIKTIKKIDKLKHEKIVSDFDHLPASYKDLVARKMSSALDFPADKPIFRDLIDLSVDESHLPGPITRTRDPQPRQRDLEPKLEDFFKPEYNNEYCASVKIRPRTPEFDDNWSAFKISDRIFEWKSSLDD